MKTTVHSAIFILFLLATIAAQAEVKVTNPGFADHETLDYTETIGRTSQPLNATLMLVGTGTTARYEYRSVGPQLESVYSLDPTTLVSLSSETLTKAPDATVKRTAVYQDLKPVTQAEDLVVTDLGSLPIVLRCYPWALKKVSRIIYVGNLTYGGGGLSFELRVVGQETVSAAGRSWLCWHATTGLSGALSLVLPKTDWWFAVDGTHPLVKTMGPAGGPGSPTRTLLLLKYTVEK